MKEFLIFTLFALLMLATILFGLGLIVAIVLLVAPWVWFVLAQYEEWVEEIQRGIKQRRVKKKLIKEKLKELI